MAPKRFQKFEPVTVRAAARLIRMSRMGRISTGDVAYHLRLLSAMDRHAGPNARPALRRLATRRAHLGSDGIVGVPAPVLVRKSSPARVSVKC